MAEQQFVDPFGGVKQGMNALLGVARLNMADRQMDLAAKQDAREQQKFESEQEMLPLKYQQAKMELGMQYLPSVTRESYADFYRWATEEPLNKKKGLGTIPKELMPNPSVVAAMAPEDFENTKKRWFMTGKQLSEMSVADYKTNLEKGLADAKAKASQSEIAARSGANMAEIAARKELEEASHRNALARYGRADEVDAARTQRDIELAKTRGTGGGSRDPRMMELINQAEARAKEKRALAAQNSIYANTSAWAKVQEQIDAYDRDIQALAQRAKQLGFAPEDVLVAGGLSQGGVAEQQPGAGQPAGGGPTKIRTYVPGKGFVEQAPTAAGAP